MSTKAPRTRIPQLPFAGWCFAALSAATGAYCLHIYFGVGGAASGGFFGDGVYNAVMIGASLTLMLRALSRRRDRAALLLIGAGMLCWALGDLYYTIFYAGLANPPTPSVDDALYLSYYPLLFAGIALLVRARVRGLSAALWLDGLDRGVRARGRGRRPGARPDHLGDGWQHRGRCHEPRLPDRRPGAARGGDHRDRPVRLAPRGDLGAGRPGPVGAGPRRHDLPGPGGAGHLRRKQLAGNAVADLRDAAACRRVAHATSWSARGRAELADARGAGRRSPVSRGAAVRRPRRHAGQRSCPLPRACDDRARPHACRARIPRERSSPAGEPQAGGHGSAHRPRQPADAGR